MIRDRYRFAQNQPQFNTSLLYYLYYFVLTLLFETYAVTNHPLHQLLSRELQTSPSSPTTVEISTLMMHGIFQAPVHVATAYSVKQYTDNKQ